MPGHSDSLPWSNQRGFVTQINSGIASQRQTILAQQIRRIAFRIQKAVGRDEHTLVTSRPVPLSSMNAPVGRRDA